MRHDDEFKRRAVRWAPPPVPMFPPYTSEGVMGEDVAMQMARFCKEPLPYGGGDNQLVKNRKKEYEQEMVQKRQWKR